MQQQNFQTENNKKDDNPPGRRSFLKTAAVFGAAACVPTALVQSCAKSPKAPPIEKENDLPVIAKHRTLGSGAYSFEVSALGFGVMGMNHHRGISPDKNAMIKLLHQAVEHGITLFDTAEVYGPHINEELAGEGLYPFRDKIHVTTKFGHKIVNGKHIAGEMDSTPQTIRRVAEESLKRLRVDTIDLFYQHRLDPAIPIEDVAGTVKDLIKEGKVKRFGLCEVVAEIIRRAHAVQPVTAVQSEYHLMWREPENTIFSTLQELGIGFVPYSPINRGFLSGTLNEYTKFAGANDNRAILPRFTPEAIRKNTAIVEALNIFGRTRGLTTTQISLAWLLAKEAWIVPIPGTTKLSHLEENLRAAEVSLHADEWKELEAILANIPIMGDRYPVSEQKQVGS